MPIDVCARDAALYKAVDAWIAKDLAARYDRALSEALPPDMLDLLRE